MSGGVFPILVEVIKVGLSPILAAITAIWMFNRKQREQIHCFVGWDTFASGPDAEIPYLAVQNRSDRTVMIRAFNYRSGLLRTTIPRKVAIYWEDPTDLHFPMPVEAGETRKFRLDPHEAKRLAEAVGRLSKMFHHTLRVPRLFAELQTMAGTKVGASLERIAI